MRLQMGHRSEAQPQRQNDRGRSALHAHRFASPISSARFAPERISRFSAALIRYAIENNRIAKDYLLNYTNAAFIVKDDFKLPEDDGVFSGFDAKKQSYDRSTWNYSGTGGAQVKNAGMQTGSRRRCRRRCRPCRKKSTSTSRCRIRSCVFQLLKQTLFALHAGNGRAHHRHSARSISEGCRSLHFRSAKTAT